jgi:abortive infection bacteriophage resistance protein
MSLVPFDKPPFSYLQQLEQLQERGLKIPNVEKATHLLESISYYRLSGYWYPLLADKENHTFKESATFDTAFNLYCFDRELRVLIIQELEKIEVSIRAKMIYLLSHQNGAFWYQDANLFKNEIKHSNDLISLDKEYKRSDADFIVAFRSKYSNPLPPSWMLLELTSFGTLSSLFSNLKPTRTKRNIANYFGLNENTFASWMHSIVYIRNVCAHHSRLWNRVMSIQPIKPIATRKTWLIDSAVANNKTYFILSMILYLLQTINPNNSFSQRFQTLLAKYHNVDTKAMGFPSNWKEENLWKK